MCFKGSEISGRHTSDERIEIEEKKKKLFFFQIEDFRWYESKRLKFLSQKFSVAVSAKKEKKNH